MMRSPNTTRVVIVDDHALFAESMKIALGLEGYDVRLATPTTHGRSHASLLSHILRLGPRVVLLDLDLGSFGNGVRLVQPLTCAGVAMIVVTGSAERPRWGEALRYGARKVMPKSAALEEILATVRKVNDGRLVLAREEREELLSEWHRHRSWVNAVRSRLESLTHRESEVLAQLMEGHQVREIAQSSVVSVATVRTQVKSILSKLEVSSQLAAVGLAHQVEWESSPHVQIPEQRRPIA